MQLAINASAENPNQEFHTESGSRCSHFQMALGALLPLHSVVMCSLSMTLGSADKRFIAETLGTWLMHTRSHPIDSRRDRYLAAWACHAILQRLPAEFCKDIQGAGVDLDSKQDFRKPICPSPDLQ